MIVRYRQDGKGWWYVISDHTGRILAEVWHAGVQFYARRAADVAIANINAAVRA